MQVDDSLLDYVLRIVQRTRESEQLALAVSPRGSLMLFHAAQAMAYLEGRTFCNPTISSGWPFPPLLIASYSAIALPCPSNALNRPNTFSAILLTAFRCRFRADALCPIPNRQPISWRYARDSAGEL